MKSKKLLLIMCLLVAVLSISSISAAEIDDTHNDTLITSEANPLASHSETDNENELSNGMDDSDIMADAAEENNLLNNGEKTFSDLQVLIDESEGEITLNDNYKYHNGDNAEGITINKNLIINGNGKIIDGANASRIFKVTTACTSLTLNDITLENGYAKSGAAIYFCGGNSDSYEDLSYSDLSLNHNTFINNYAHFNKGGAIYWESSGNVDLNYCIFKDNHATIDNPTYRRFTGGAIFTAAKNFTANNCEFINNTAIKNNGGGIAIANPDNVKITNCNFTNNNANDGGGLYVHINNPTNITVTGGLFKANNVHGTGGGIFINDYPYQNNNNGCYNLTLRDVDFYDNVAGSFGGAIYTELQSSDNPNNIMDVQDCTFNNNMLNGSEYYNGGSGGAIYSNANKLTIKNVDFIQTKALKQNCRGGVIYNYAMNDFNFTLENVNFIETEISSEDCYDAYGTIICAYADYGAIINLKNVNVTNSKVMEGQSPSELSAMRFYKNQNNDGNYFVNIEDVNFINNSIGVRGIEISSGNDFIKANLKNINFINNTMNEVLSIDDYSDDNNSQSVLENIRVINNRYLPYNGGSSGDIYFVDYRGNNLTMRNCEFKNNENTSLLYSQAKNVNLIDNTFSDNADLRDYQYKNIYLSDIEKLNIENCNFTNTDDNHELIFIQPNNDLTVNITKTNFINHTGLETIAISTYRGITSNISISNTNFINNTGSVSFNQEDGELNLKITDVNFINNTAASNGGAVNINSPSKSDIIITNSNFTNNIQNGISDSRDPLGGGAIYIKTPNNNFESNLTINNNQFINNSGANGGAIYLCSESNSKANINISNNEFTGNKATDKDNNDDTPSGGGAIYIKSEYNSEGNLTIDNNQFTGNIAEENGGSILISTESSKLNTSISNSNFTNNEAYKEKTEHSDSVVGGGAIYFKSGYNDQSELTIENVNFNNNSASNGGAISSSGNMKINNSNFTDNHESYYKYNPTGIVRFTITPIDDKYYNVTVYSEQKYNELTIKSPDGAIDFNSDIGQNYDWNTREWYPAYSHHLYIYIDDPYYYHSDSNNYKIYDPNDLKLNYTFTLPITYTIDQLICTFTDEDNKYYDYYKAEEGYRKGSGGAIYYQNTNNNDNNNYINISNSNFNDNWMDNGGAIAINTNSKFNLTIQNANFTNNHANMTNQSAGGAIAVNNNRDYPVGININSTRFEYNTANNTGGAISVKAEREDYTDLITNNTVLRHNSADIGGAIYAETIRTKLIDTEFDKNKANSKNLTYIISNNTLILNLTGWENHVNGIYSTTEDVEFIKHHYNDEYHHEGEFNQTIVLEVYDETGNLKDNVTFKTNVTGQVSYNINKLRKGNYTFHAYHPDDTYYTFIETTGKIESTKNEIDVNMTVSVENVKYGENIIINVTLKDIDGNRITNVTVTVTVNGTTYEINITDGVGSKVISSPAAGNNYLANATFNGKDIYAYANATDYFNVTKANSTVSINVNNVTYDANVSVEFVVMNATILTYIVKDESRRVVIENTTVIDLNRNITLPVLKAGNYTIILVNAENENYTGSAKSANFTVKPANSTLEIKNITYTYGETGNTTLTSTGASEVNAIIADHPEATVKIENGYITVTGLAAGNYTLKATTIPDENHTATTKTVNITVLKAGSLVEIHPIGNATFNESVIVVFDVKNMTTVTYIIKTTDGETIKSGVIEQISADGLVLDNLEAGNYTITIYNRENTNYTASNATANFTVNKAKSRINVTATNVTFPNNVTVTIKVENQTSVTYNVTQNGKTVIENTLWNGEIIRLENLAAGNYTINVANAESTNYTYSVKSANFTVNKAPSSVDVNNITFVYGESGNSTVTYSGAVGIDVKIADYPEAKIIVENGVITVSDLDAQEYNLIVTTVPDANHTSVSKVVNVTVTQKTDYEMNVSSTSPEVGGNATVTVSVPKNATGNVTVTLENGTNYTATVENGTAKVNVPHLPEGENNVTVTYSSAGNYGGKSTKTIIIVKNNVLDASDMKRGWDSPYDYQAKLINNEGNGVEGRTITFTVNGKQYNVTTDSNGIAKLTASKLPVGKYNITTTNPETGESINRTVEIVARIIENKDLTKDYESSKHYTIRAIGDDGEPVGTGVVVVIKTNGITYKMKTDKNGYATLPIHLIPKTYAITATYHKYTVKNTLKVKQTLKLVKKTVKVKKGKKIVLKATLKWTNGKAIKGKVIKFKFKGKTYKAKTNKKGVAKVSIKNKKIIKKLKKGKKYTYSAKYIKNMVKGKVKIK